MSSNSYIKKQANSDTTPLKTKLDTTKMMEIHAKTHWNTKKKMSTVL